MEEKNENMDKVEEAKRGGSRLRGCGHCSVWIPCAIYEQCGGLCCHFGSLISNTALCGSHLLCRSHNPVKGLKIVVFIPWWNLSFDASERGVSLNVGFF